MKKMLHRLNLLYFMENELNSKDAFYLSASFYLSRSEAS